MTVGKKIIYQLIGKCSENIDEKEMIYNRTLNEILLNDYKKVIGSFIIYFHCH